FYLTSTDCSLYNTPVACETVVNAECAWNATTGACGWREGTCEGMYVDRNECLGDDRCNWVYDNEKCMNPIGYSAVYNGIFAGAMIVGALFGAVSAGHFIAKFGHKVSFLVSGIVSVVSSVMYHVASATDQFWVLCTGR
ncbi:hexose transporter, partial [Trypanosoma grayi]|uniref:hexose transporter n=1 Tax=Trypanosoma grayi TaxID=71804 RepID=UPI0004F468F0